MYPMPTPKPTYHFHPLGDQAVLIRFSYPAGAALSNYILAVYERLRQPDTHYITDLVPAYDSLTVFYSFQECGAISSTEV